VNADFAPTARLAKQAAELILSEGLPEQVLLNINVPEGWKGAVRFHAAIEENHSDGVA